MLQKTTILFQNVHLFSAFQRCILCCSKISASPEADEMTAVKLHFGCRGRDYKAEEERGSSWADSASQSGCDMGKEFLTDGRSLFKKISWAQRDKVTHWQDICVYRNAATAAPSALSINNWFEPSKGSLGRYTCYKLEVVFPTQLKNCWTLSCDTQMSRQDFWESVLYVLLCSKWVIVTFQFLKVKSFKRVF